MAVTIFFLAVTVRWNLSINGAEHFASLARSFAHGELNFREPPDGTWADTTPHEGKYYWPLGPLPALVLLPFTFLTEAVGTTFYQGYLQPFLVGALLALVFVCARRVGYAPDDSGYLAFGFTFATACLGVALWPWSWYFSQILTCVLLFAIIAEMIGKRRPIVLGVLCALILATRMTAALVVFWCIGEFLSDEKSRQQKLRALGGLIFPCLIALGGLLLYNYARFGNIFEQGYAEQLVPKHAETARAAGLFSVHHLAGNIYTFLFSAPNPVMRNDGSVMLAFPFAKANPWGMSVFVTSPCFLYLLGLKFRDATARWLLGTAFLIALPIMFYYGVGYRQFGYRYALDFLPLLYFLLFRNYRLQRGTLTRAFKIVIIASAFWNLYLFSGYFIWGSTSG